MFENSNMPHRFIVSSELSKLFSVLSHPHRIRIIEELHNKELTVSQLKNLLNISSAAVSQQLAILRSSHIVCENRNGRNVYYQLTNPNIASWILQGLDFIMPNFQEIDKIRFAINSAKVDWGEE